MNLPERVSKKVSCVVRGAELLLKKNRKKGPIRTYLIRQLWHGDRVLAALRDGEDYSIDFARMEMNALAAHKALVARRKQCHCDEDFDRR